jgi:hypothetical protein
VSHSRPLLSLALLLAISLPSPAQDVEQPDPLFASQDILDVTITAPLETIMRDRPIEEYVSGTFAYRDSGGRLLEFNVGLRTRGNFRRREETCEFAPLRINFKKSEIDDTLFDKQDKLKLVTHCQNASSTYQQAIVAEYVAYRIFNLLTDVSFRVRLLNVRYVDSDDSDNERISYAILVEDSDRLSERIGISRAEVPRLSSSQLDPYYSALGAVFHYLIGNTDYSQVATAPGENCCHNHEILAQSNGYYLAVPYDFDMSGFVNAPHARPNPRFRLRSVRQRLYRGRCIHNGQLEAATQIFLDKRDEIERLVDSQAQLSSGTKNKQLRYLDSFFSDIESPRAREKHLVDECLRTAGVSRP